MPRKAKAKLEEYEVAPLEKITKKPRSRKTQHVSETLADLKPDLPALQTAIAEAPPPQQEVITHPEREPIRHQPKPESNGSHADAVLARRPSPRTYADAVDRPVFGPIPDDFFPAGSRRDEGIRVLKKTIIRNGEKVSVAGIQFAANRTPSRQEKDLLEQIHEPNEAVADKEKFAYQPPIQVWTREGDPHDRLGDNTLDAIRKMNDLADARKEDRERMQEVMGR